MRAKHQVGDEVITDFYWLRGIAGYRDVGAASTCTSNAMQVSSMESIRREQSELGTPERYKVYTELSGVISTVILKMLLVRGGRTTKGETPRYRAKFCWRYLARQSNCDYEP